MEMYNSWRLERENMNATQLKKWKEEQIGVAEEIVHSLQNPMPENITELYPEYNLIGDYTTSLDPYTPLWALLPFFGKIIVGILPYLKNEDEFIEWYGVSTKQMLKLHELGRVEIRVLFPQKTNTIPKTCNCFFERKFPSTIRDIRFDHKILGEDKLYEIRERFNQKVSDSIGHKSIDGFLGNKMRALRTAESAYIQLHALGYEKKAYEFEDTFAKDANVGMRWLELCRLFLIGPIHYSLLGIHCVSSNAPQLFTFDSQKTVKFPSDLGKMLVEAMNLTKNIDEINSFTIDDCISIYPDFERARETLFELNKAIKEGVEDRVLSSAEDLRKMLQKAKKRNKMYLHVIKAVAATGIGLTTAPFDLGIGLLMALGFNVASEVGASKIDKHLKPVVSKISRTKKHLNLLIGLDEDIKKKYKYTG